MAKPSALPVWGTTGPITTPSGGKQAAGFVPGERPGAQYLNWLFNLIYLWVQWLSTRPRWSWQFPFYAQLTNAELLSSPNSVHSTGVGSAGAINITVPVGEQITDIGAYVKGDASHNVTYLLVRGNLDGTFSTVDTTTLTAPAATWTRYSHTLATPELVVDGYSYWLAVTFSGAGCYCGNVGFNSGTP